MLRSLDAVLDVMRVPASGDASVAVVPCPAIDSARGERCEILIVGGGTGGVAAALAAAAAGRAGRAARGDRLARRPAHRTGRQRARRARAHRDLRRHGELLPAARSAARRVPAARRRRGRRRRLQSRQLLGEPARVRAARRGRGDRSACSQPHVESGRLHDLPAHARRSPSSTDGDRIASVVAMGLDDARLHRFEARIGDRRHRARRPAAARRRRVRGRRRDRRRDRRAAGAAAAGQAALRAELHLHLRLRAPRRRRAARRSPRPEKYEHYRDVAAVQPAHRGARRRDLRRGRAAGSTTGCTRRGPAPRAACGPTAACSTATASPAASPTTSPSSTGPATTTAIAASSKAARSPRRRRCRTPSASASASCTGCRPRRPPTGDRLGAPELRLRADVMGTADGLSKHPYIRESRRIRALKTIVEQEVSARHQAGPRAAHFADSVGVGWYPIDIHRSGAGRRRRQLPHEAVPDSARRAAAGARRRT